jgi:hypothetical protein
MLFFRICASDVLLRLRRDFLEHYLDFKRSCLYKKCVYFALKSKLSMVTPVWLHLCGCTCVVTPVLVHLCGYTCAHILCYIILFGGC